MRLAQTSTGSISGTVYEQDGTTPIEYITVEVIGTSGYFGICTDSSGHFELAGLPLNVPFRVMASPWQNCQQGGNYVIEYWPQAVSLNSAGFVTLTAENPDRTDIDFTLDPGGVISGTTYASNGVTPLPHIAVSFTDGNHIYGDIFCSDENGQYSFHSVPFNVPVRLQAYPYRDGWCDAGADYLPEYWGETLNNGPTPLTVTQDSPTRAGINFSMDLVDPADPEPPYLAAWPQSGIIEAHNWPDGARVKLKIEDPSTPLSPDYSAETNAPDAVFYLADQFDIEPGMIVTVSGAYTTKVITVDSVTITNVDADLNTVSGTTAPGNWMWMWFNDDACCRSTVADEDGNWTIDIGAPGPNGEPEADIVNGMNGAVHVPSGDNGRTSVAWAFPDPNIDAWYLDGTIEAFGWPTGTPLTLKIENTSTPLSPDYFAETVVTQTVPWEPTIPYATFNIDDTFELEPGMIVTIYGEYMIREIVIRNLGITNIDQEHDTISGIAPPDNWLWMYFDASCDPVCRSTDSDENGNWMIDYSVPGAQGQPVANINPESSGAIHLPSGDGKTSVAWSIPPDVIASARVGDDPTNAASVEFTVTFSEPVTGVDAGDFALAATDLNGASIMNVAGSGSTYTVTVNTGVVGSVNGTIRLDVVDNDSIRDADNNPLSGLGAGNGNFNTGDTYTIAAHVATPMLIFPRRNYVTSQSPLTFDWNTVTDAARYEIEFARDSGFTQDRDPHSVTDSTFSGSFADGKYYWRVQAYNAVDEPGTWSVARWFIIDTTAPQAPTLRLPTNNASVRHVPIFRWNAVSDAVLYQFQLDNDSNFSSPLVSVEQRTLSRKPAGGLRGTYSWRVRARDAAGNWSEWSQVFTVNIFSAR